MKANKTSNELKSFGFKHLPVEDRRTVKNGGKSSRICSWIRLGSVTEAPRLGFSSRKHVFSPKTAEMHSIGVRDQFTQPPSPIYSQNEEVLVAQWLLEEDF